MSDTCPSVLWRCRLGAVRKYLVRVSDYSGRPMFDSLYAPKKNTLDAVYHGCSGELGPDGKSKRFVVALTYTLPILPVVTGDETLNTADAVNVLDELLEAQTHHYVLGLKLKLPVHLVDSICATHPQPRHRLLQMLIEFMKQLEPRPTWRVIIHALKTPAINLPQLAKKLEVAHCPHPCISTHDELPIASAAPTRAGMLTN